MQDWQIEDEVAPQRPQALGGNPRVVLAYVGLIALPFVLRWLVHSLL